MSAAARVAQAQSPDKAAEKSKVAEKVVEKVKDKAAEKGKAPDKGKAPEKGKTPDKGKGQDKGKPAAALALDNGQGQGFTGEVAAVAGVGRVPVERSRSLRVMVHTPLVVRASEDVDSEQVGTLRTGQMATVVMEKVINGKVRAKISLDSISRQVENVSPRVSPSRSRGSSPERSSNGAVYEEGSVEVLYEGDGGDSASPTGRAPSMSSCSPTVSERAEFAHDLRFGWVTLVKDGRKLVTSRVRQSIGARQASSQAWARRMATDRAAKYDQKTNHKYDEKSVSLELAVDPAQVRVEMAADPNGLGFAYGGIHPGTLHARGKLVETHTVSYSVGLVGEYLLHVRLRQQAAALPGSPFRLLVTPGLGHARSCKVPPGVVVGNVGKNISTPGADPGCGITFHTYDLMGNKCIQGGAKVTGNELDAKGHEKPIQTMQIIVKDNMDGSYSLHWCSEASGSYTMAVKVFGEHIMGSPITIRLKSVTPMLSKTVLTGDGLKSGVAGKGSSVQVTFFDSYNNAAVPGERFRFGLALLQGRNFKDVETQEFTMVCLDENACIYEMTYKPQKQGPFDLHIWADDLQSTSNRSSTLQYERTPLAGSPFHVVITAGVASPQVSFIDGWVKESRAVDKNGKVLDIKSDEVIAGDTVILRPFICDALGNNTVLETGALDIVVVFPDGSRKKWLDEKGLAKVSSEDRAAAASIKFTVASKGGVTTYDIRHEATHAGKHEVHVRLYNTPIRGSPVLFTVQSAVPEVKNARAYPPEESPLYCDTTYNIVLKTFDRFNNPIPHGGLPVGGRMQLMKNNAHDLTTLIPANHSIEIEDNDNGTYNIIVRLAISATVKVIVNMDKNIPASGGELPALQLVFAGPNLAVPKLGAPFEAPSDRGTVRRPSGEVTPAALALDLGKVRV